MRALILFCGLAACVFSLSLALASTGSAAPQITDAVPLGATPTATCVAQYTCSATPGATIVSGTVDTGNHCDDCTTAVTLPFPARLYDALYTGVNVSSNGNAQFVSTNPEFANACLPVETMGPTVFAYWDDLVTDGTTCTGGCGIYTSVSGIAPNRIFNIEWRTFYFSNPGNAYFEIRLFESSSSFEIIIGQINTGGTATIGVQDGAGNFTQCVCGTQAVPNTRIVFTTGICGTPFPTSTPGPSTTTPSVTGTAPAGTGTASVSATASTGTPTATPTSTELIDTSTPTFTPSATVTTCPISFTDVQPTDYFYNALRYLYCGGAISGYADNTFRPYSNTTRGQLSKIVALAVGWQLACTAQHFSDVPPNHPFYCFVETAYNHGVVSGYADGTFRPGENVTRAQLSKIIVLAMQWRLLCPVGHFSDVLPANPFYCWIESAYSHGAIGGYSDHTFRPGNPATRGQIAVIIHRGLGSP